MIRRVTCVALGVFILAICLTACSTSGDDDGDEVVATATDAPQPLTTATEDAAPTPTEVIPATATATDPPAPTATATASPTLAPSPTPTATASPTPIPIAQNPFADAPTLDAVLENYTVHYSGEFETPEGATETIEIFIEQSDASHYHLQAGEEVEIWVIGAETYFRNPADGSVFLIPSAVDPGLVSPAAYLIQVPNPANVPEAAIAGDDTIDGRPATHYRVQADQINDFGLAEDQTVIDPEGEIDVWIDKELGFISQMMMDVEWTDETGARQAAKLELTISSVGSTAEVVAPL